MDRVLHSCPGGERAKAALALVWLLFSPTSSCSLKEELLDVSLKAKVRRRAGCQCGGESFHLYSGFRSQRAVAADLLRIHTEVKQCKDLNIRT